jgi:hypothetical protein
VGDSPDLEPPVWDGAYTVDNSRAVGLPPCLPVPMTRRVDAFQWIGLIDETWATEEQFVIAVPRLESGEPVLGAGEISSVSFGGCAAVAAARGGPMVVLFGVAFLRRRRRPTFDQSYASSASATRSAAFRRSS